MFHLTSSVKYPLSLYMNKLKKKNLGLCQTYLKCKMIANKLSCIFRHFKKTLKRNNIYQCKTLIYQSVSRVLYVDRK